MASTSPVTLGFEITKNNGNQVLGGGITETTKIEYVDDFSLQDEAGAESAACSFKVRNRTANYQDVIIYVNGGLIYNIKINATAYSNS